jgi:hypothetical protein
MNPLVYQGFKPIDTPGWWIMAQTIALQHFEPLSTIVIPEEPQRLLELTLFKHPLRRWRLGLRD